MRRLTAEQKERYEEQGYLVVEDLIDVGRYIAPLMGEYDARLDELARELLAEGKIGALHDDLPFGQRLTRVYAECGKVHAGYFDFSLPFSNVAADQPCHFGPAVFEMLRCPEVLDVVEDLIGPEIYSNPVQHVRLKPPEKDVPLNPETGLSQLGATYWHQDNGVVIADADDTEMLTVWIPLNDATVENGCLCVVPRNHRVGLLTHCTTPAMGSHLPDKFFDVARATPVPIRSGGALFMHRRTPHSSLSNSSEDVRCSLDLRYNPTGQPTGRPEFPGFVARSRRDPASELRDPAIWERLWMETRARMAAHPEAVQPFYRWKVGDPVCA